MKLDLVLHTSALATLPLASAWRVRFYPLEENRGDQFTRAGPYWLRLEMPHQRGRPAQPRLIYAMVVRQPEPHDAVLHLPVHGEELRRVAGQDIWAFLSEPVLEFP
jgi:hypothetical protein